MVMNPLVWSAAVAATVIIALLLILQQSGAARTLLPFSHPSSAASYPAAGPTGEKAKLPPLHCSSQHKKKPKTQPVATQFAPSGS